MQNLSLSNIIEGSGNREPYPGMTLPKISLQIGSANEPLLDRVPTTDENGKPLGDMMMIIPGLRNKPQAYIAQTVQNIHDALNRFSATVLFAEVNVHRNLLWISVRPVEGVRAGIAGAIQERVPGAKLVSHL